MEVVAHFVIPALVGVVIGVASGLLGIGGGTIMVPVFRLAFGMSPIMSTATSLFAIIPTSISGAVSHVHNRTCVPALGIAAGLGGALLSPVGVWLANISPDWLVMLVAAIIIGYSAVNMFRKAMKLPKPTKPAKPRTKEAGTRAKPPEAAASDACDASVRATNAGAANAGATKYGATSAGATRAGATSAGAASAGATKFGATNSGAAKYGATNSGATKIGCAEEREQKLSSANSAAPAAPELAGPAPATSSAPMPAVPSLSRKQLLTGFAIGLAAGLASGYVGVGGGFIMVPLMLSLIGIPMRLASGTSLIGVMILAVPGVIEQGLLGNIEYLAGIAVVIGSIPGAVLGARLVSVVPERALRIVFGCFLLVAAVLLALNEFGILG